MKEVPFYGWFIVRKIECLVSLSRHEAETLLKTCDDDRGMVIREFLNRRLAIMCSYTHTRIYRLKEPFAMETGSLS